MIHIFIDLEMNTISKEKRAPNQYIKHEIVEIGAIKLNGNFEVIDSYRSYVKPIYNPIADNCTMITGITDKDVAGAQPFNSEILQFIDWIMHDKKYDEEVTIYSWSGTDKRQLLGECELKNVFDDDIDNPFTLWIDFQKTFSSLLGISQVLSLENALNLTQLDFEGERHSALSDAGNCVRLLQLTMNKKRFERRTFLFRKLLQAAPDGTTVGEILAAHQDSKV